MAGNPISGCITLMTIAVGQVFVDLYCKYKDRNMLYPTQARAEWVVNHPSDGPMELDYKKRVRWSAGLVRCTLYGTSRICEALCADRR